MPNWCQNLVTFTHNDPEMITKLVNGANDEQLFNTFVPRPTEKEDDWYHWNTENWGTKWDVAPYEEAFVEGEKSDTVVLGFDSAWAPPVKFYEKMEELGFYVEAYYFEPGMGFCGRYEDGFDEYVEIEGDSKWVKEFVPEYIDEVFDISGAMAEWEEDE